MTHFVHKNASQGTWFALSAAEQLGNIGSEVHRAFAAQDKDQPRYNNAVFRALDLFDLTLEDKRHRGARRREVGLVREIFCDAVFGKHEYHTTLQDIMRYLDQFAMAAALNR